MDSIQVDMNNLTDDEREQLLRLIEKSNEKKRVAWKPKTNELYIYVDDSGETVARIWTDSNADMFRYTTGNCYHTTEEAVLAVETLQAEVEFRRYAEQHNQYDINWNDKTLKFFVYYDYEVDEINITSCVLSKSTDVFFTSLKIAKAAIESIGEYRIKKYILKVVDDDE